MTKNMRFLWYAFAFFVGSAIASTFSPTPGTTLVVSMLVFMPIYMVTIYFLDKIFLSKGSGG